jgi:tetratricopeptide (TPR) repeat protein
LIPEYTKKHLPLYLAAALGLAVALLYLPSVNFGYITLDDSGYTFQNDLVNGGLTRQGIREAFTTIQLATWTPLTLLSLMADSGYSGMNPGGFHRTNVILHTLNVLLLFAFLYRATGSPWKSLFAAALWSVHPLRVEPVAWIAARKDLLSGSFFLLTLLAYGEYVKERRTGWYFAALALMFLGLASKSILVVLPPLLLILDFWPFGRYGKGRESLKRLLAEKIPFFALAAVFSAVTLYALSGFIQSTGETGVPARLTDMATSYTHYLKETLWPFGLAMVDKTSFPGLSGFWAAVAGLLLLAATCILCRAGKTIPAVAAGWGWYLITVFPVSGIVPVGLNSVADRYTYLPHMGLAVLAVWGADFLCRENWTARKTVLTVLALTTVALAAATGSYLSKWKDSETLFTYHYSETGSPYSGILLARTFTNLEKHEKALAILDEVSAKDPANHMVEQTRGIALNGLGRREESLEAFLRAHSLNPDYIETLNFIVSKAIDLNQFDLARHYSSKALELDPKDPAAVFNLGKIELRTGNIDGALALIKKASSFLARNGDFMNKAGIALAQSGYPGEASGYFEKAVEIAPSNPDFNYNLARALLEGGHGERAEKYFMNSIRLDPGKPDAHYLLGSWLESAGRQEEAAVQYRELLRINPGDAGAAAALERLGKSR